MIVAVLYILWSFSMVLLGWYGTWSAWNQLQLRLEEADENSTGFETPFAWTKAIQLHSLACMVGIITLIAGYAHGENIHEFLPFFNYYDDDEREEAINDSILNGAITRDAVGTAADADLLYHFTTSLLGWATISVSSWVAALVALILMPAIFEQDAIDCDFGNINGSNGINSNIYQDVG